MDIKQEEASAPVVAQAPARAAPFDGGHSVSTWNAIAAEAGLPLVRLPLSEARRRKLRSALQERPDLWALVVEEIRRRGQWARDAHFPTFDQVLQRATRDRLLEGNYREREAAAPDFLAIAKGLMREGGK